MAAGTVVLGSRGISVKHLSIGDGDTSLLDDINLEWKSSAVHGVIGASGSGKSTLLSVIAGHWKNTRGVSRLPLGHDSPALISYLDHGARPFPRTTVREAIRRSAKLGRAVIDVETLMECLGIEHLADEYMDESSHGEKLRAMIATVVAQGRPFILLDEPTSGLDEDAALKVLTLLKDMATDKSITVVVSLHDPSAETIAMLGSVTVIQAGKICNHQSGDVLLSLEADADAAEQLAKLESSRMVEIGVEPDIRPQVRNWANCFRELFSALITFELRRTYRWVDLLAITITFLSAGLSSAGLWDNNPVTDEEPWNFWTVSSPVWAVHVALHYRGTFMALYAEQLLRPEIRRGSLSRSFPLSSFYVAQLLASTIVGALYPIVYWLGTMLIQKAPFDGGGQVLGALSLVLTYVNAYTIGSVSSTATSDFFEAIQLNVFVSVLTAAASGSFHSVPIMNSWASKLVLFTYLFYCQGATMTMYGDRLTHIPVDEMLADMGFVRTCSYYFGMAFLFWMLLNLLGYFILRYGPSYKVKR